MRKILFRGSRIDNGEWICGGYFTADSRHFICNEDETAQVDPESVGEFTGLLDKNGEKIFEGDLVTDGSGRMLPISFKEGCFCANKVILASYALDEENVAYVEIVEDFYESGNY